MKVYFSWLYFEPSIIRNIKIDAFLPFGKRIMVYIYIQTSIQVIFSSASPNTNYFVWQKYTVHEYFFQERILFPWDSLHYHLILNFYSYLKAFFSKWNFLTRQQPTLMWKLYAIKNVSFTLHVGIKIYEVIYTVFDIEFTSSYNLEKCVLVISSVIFIDLEIEYFD